MLNKLTNKGERKMKTKKIEAGLYQVTINNNIYEIEKDFDNQFQDWFLWHKSTGEKIDTCASLKEAKSVIQTIEERA